MRIHYLFGNRYDISETRGVNDLRHRNAVYAVSDPLREYGFNLEFHYCTNAPEQQLDIASGDIVINLHPQIATTRAPFFEAMTEGACGGIWIDSADTSALIDETHPLGKILNKADFVMVPTVHHANLVSAGNKRVVVIPPVIETESRLPSLDLDDVKNNIHPLRITCIPEIDNYESFIRILPDLVRFSGDILPIEIGIVPRSHTGFINPVKTETLVNTIRGMAQILSKNSQSLTFSDKDLTIEHLNRTLHWSDCLLVLPGEDTVEGNIQIPLMGLHTGNFTFVPSGQKVYNLLSSYGVIPYQPENLTDTLKKILSAPHEILTGSMADGRKIIREYHNPRYVAALLAQTFKTELYHKQIQSKRRRPSSSSVFDWNKISADAAQSPASASEKQSENV